ncbi:shikimate dehydrogenase [Merismopedia glauca]|uniref:Shikimate dehydrogenase n=1 Tax=Merismopedia glauca CCAP 1448/3 TaxID=1296344 RepID=A0A2T1BY48_9CYAN|nr:shikimate dehydrogenase [Merismopedia glauca]PSB00950.1 shikimate dehydrogenase [Merismopedia glauca CCAP 1448/3]
MTNTPIQVTTDLGTVLQRIEQKLDKIDEKFEQKLDNLQKDVNNLKIGQTKLETEFTSLKEDVKELKSSQKALVTDVADLKGAKGLVIPIVVAVLTSLFTLLARSIPLP